jgi:hypothetical protein
MTQLPLPIVLDTDPRVQLAACRKLQRMVDRKRESYEVRRFREHRDAALRGRRLKIDGA